MTDSVEIFNALGDKTRLRLVNLLLHADQDVCVCEMVDALKLPQYQISKHLTILKSAKLLQASRRGTWVYYRLNCEDSPFLRDLFKVLSRHLNQQIFSNDAATLNQRLSLRQDGKCVVGFIAGVEAARMLRRNNKARSHVSKKTRHFHLHA
jgi:DNA-binding transcriptional ArsR family regulator